MRYVYSLLALIIISCSEVESGKDSETVNLRVDYYQPVAIGLAPQLVYRIQEGNDIGSDDWNYSYEKIENFDYEPGFVYDLEIEKNMISNPPADGGNAQLKLKSVIAKTEIPADSSYILLLKRTYDTGESENFVYGNQEAGYSLVNRLEILCNENCENLKSALESSPFVYGTFQVESNTSVKLMDVEGRDEI